MLATLAEDSQRVTECVKGYPHVAQINQRDLSHRLHRHCGWIDLGCRTVEPGPKLAGQRCGGGERYGAIDRPEFGDTPRRERRISEHDTPRADGPRGLSSP